MIGLRLGSMPYSYHSGLDYKFVVQNKTKQKKSESLERAAMQIKQSDGQDVLPRGAFPWAFHSGLCGVAGNHIQMAWQFIESEDVPLAGTVSFLFAFLFFSSKQERN